MDILLQKYVTTRKPHECWGCGRKFQKGSSLQYVKAVDNGVISGVYWCEVCQHVLNNGGFDGGD